MRPAAEPTWKSLDSGLVEQFAANGYVIVHQFASANTCDVIRKAILERAAAGDTVKVRWSESTFDTFNGTQVDDNVSVLKYLYDGHLKREMQKLCTTSIETLEDREVGISVNLTKRGGQFQPHFDRHMLTAVLYVNDDYEGGEMWFYPRLRHFVRTNQWLLRKILVSADRVARTLWYRALFAKKVVLKPRAGDLLIFEGTRTYHSVTPVLGKKIRLSVQFGYDVPGIQFDIADYYGAQGRSVNTG